MRQWFPAWTLTFVCCLLASCSKLVSVEGKVFYDGKPLTLATLIFFPEDGTMTSEGPRQAHTMSDGDGNFRLNTINKHGGVPGRYKVVVSKLEYPPDSVEPKASAPSPRGMPAVPNPVMNAKPGKQVLPAEYTAEKTTPIRVDIPAEGTKSLLIELKSKGDGDKGS